MRDWFARNFWAQMVLILAVVITFSLAITTLYIMPHAEENRQNYISDCTAQGGKYVELSGHQYCIIDGVRVGR